MPDPIIVPKGWGYERIIVNKPEYCGKILHFEKGKRCSLHWHRIKDEVFFLQSGQILLRMADGQDAIVERVMNPGDTQHIPPYLLHQMIALEESDLFEFSTQDFPEDSIRVERGD